MEAARTNIQRGIEQQRAVLSHLRYPLLMQLCRIYGLTIRDVAEIFRISKSHAHRIVHYEVPPDLYLAFKMARYFEVGVEELWGWMFDDDGLRRPLVIELSSKKLIRLKSHVREHGSMELIQAVSEEIRKMEEGIDP